MPKLIIRFTKLHYVNKVQWPDLQQLSIRDRSKPTNSFYVREKNFYSEFKRVLRPALTLSSNKSKVKLFIGPHSRDWNEILCFRIDQEWNAQFHSRSVSKDPRDESTSAQPETIMPLCPSSPVQQFSTSVVPLLLFILTNYILQLNIRA